MIIAVIYTTFTAGKRKPEKNSGLYGIRTLDLCDTGAPVSQRSRERIPYEPEFFFMVFFRNCKGCVYNCHYHPSFKCFCFVVVVVLFCLFVCLFFYWNRNVLGFYVIKESEPNCKTPHRNFNSLSDETHGKSELTVHKQSRGYKRIKKRKARSAGGRK